MNIEERLTRLENFMGDIDRIVSLYANSVQEICDKYLNILYIETADPNNKNVLILDGFLAEIDIDKLPKNVVFNVRPSHNFAFEGDVEASKIRFKRDNKYVELPLKKYDVENPGNLVFLEPDDYLQGTMYSVYINSQGIAVISSSDTGVVALQEVAKLTGELADVVTQVNGLANSQTITSLKADVANIKSLNVESSLSLMNALNLPTGSTCSTPTSANHIANQSYVDSEIDKRIKEYHANFHVFGVGEPTAANLVEGAVYYNYGNN